MTTTTAHPGHHHISVKSTALAFAGALLAVGAGFGIANLALDETVSDAPVGGFTDPFDRPGYDPNGYAGTDRENRELMHRNR